MALTCLLPLKKKRTSVSKLKVSSTSFVASSSVHMFLIIKIVFLFQYGITVLRWCAFDHCTYRTYTTKTDWRVLELRIATDHFVLGSPQTCNTTDLHTSSWITMGCYSWIRLAWSIHDNLESPQNLEMITKAISFSFIGNCHRRSRIVEF